MFRWELHPQEGYQEIKHPRHSCSVSLSQTSSQAKFLLMLSGYWQHACCYGYPRYLGSFSCWQCAALSVLLAYACRCNMRRLKGDTMHFMHSELFTLLKVGLLCARAHSATRARARRSTRFVHGKEVIGSGAVLAREECL